MRRVLLGLLLGALIFAGAVGAKVVTVTNPMSAFLDGGGYSIGNVASVCTIDGTCINGTVATAQHFDVQDPAGNVTAPQLRAGSLDPSTGLAGRIGSLYLRNDLAGNGTLWLKTGPLDTDWRQVATVP